MSRTFGVLIISHGRPVVRTLETLHRCGYTGDWRIVVDDEDDAFDAYVSRYGADRVVQFCKEELARASDTGDNFPGRLTALYARNACFQIARDLGYTHFLELDDDYDDFQFRDGVDGRLMEYGVPDLDAVFDTMLDFLDDTGASAVALAQGGDFIGGLENKRWDKKVLRKAMNTWFIRTDEDFRFMGRMNDDVTTYVLHGLRGKVFLTLMFCMITQPQTQREAGGMSDAYTDSGTYVKSFYTVMHCPSAVTIQMMGANHVRIHHHVRWRHAVPKILSPVYQKGERP